MEGRVWEMVLSLVPASEPGSRRFRYGCGEILLVVVWAVLHDRPMNWACQAENWPERWRPSKLPHPSTVSRRWRRDSQGLQATRVGGRPARGRGLPGHVVVGG